MRPPGRSEGLSTCRGPQRARPAPRGDTARAHPPAGRRLRSRRRPRGRAMHPRSSRTRCLRRTRVSAGRSLAEDPLDKSLTHLLAEVEADVAEFLLNGLIRCASLYLGDRGVCVALLWHRAHAGDVEVLAV